MRLLILPDPANVFAPSDNAILLPLLLPEAPIGILPTTSPPARSTAEVDMSAFDENMDPSSSSLSSSLKRDRDSPAEVKPVGTKVRILPLRMRVFLLFSMGVLEAFFYRGVRKMQNHDSDRYAGLGERKSIFCGDFFRVVFDGLL